MMQTPNLTDTPSLFHFRLKTHLRHKSLHFRLLSRTRTPTRFSLFGGFTARNYMLARYMLLRAAYTHTHTLFLKMKQQTWMKKH